MFVLLFLWLGSQFEAIPGSIVMILPKLGFQNAWRLIAASMVAYLFAQFVDVRIFHFWKKLTNGKHLWLRNNGSTVASQLVDTTLVICILFVGVWETDQILSAIRDGWLFKMLMALIDTPIIYGIIHLLKAELILLTLRNNIMEKKIEIITKQLLKNLVRILKRGLVKNSYKGGKSMGIFFSRV